MNMHDETREESISWLAKAQSENAAPLELTRERIPSILHSELPLANENIGLGHTRRQSVVNVISDNSRSDSSERVPHQAATRSSTTVPESSSTKRKFDDQESGPLEGDRRPEKKHQRHKDKVVESSKIGASLAARPAGEHGQLIASTSASTKTKKSENARQATATRSHTVAANAHSKDPHASTRAHSGATINTGGMPMSISDSGSSATKAVDVAVLAGHSNASRTQASKTPGHEALARKSSAKTATAKEGGASVNQPQGSKVPNEKGKVPKATFNPPGGTSTKKPLVIPRYSEIKRTYKDGRPRAPVDINLAIQSVYEKRRKLEDKTLCDTGELVDVASFLDRLHLFYDEEEMRKRNKKTKFLDGTVVFFCPQEYAKIGMNARKKLQYLVAHGATVLPVYDAEQVTHIVMHEGVKEIAQLLRRAGLKSLDDVPKHVPVLRWKWVDESGKKLTLAPIHMHAAFKEHIVYPPDYVPPPPETDENKQPVKSSTPPRVKIPIRYGKTQESDPEDSNDSGDEKISDWAELEALAPKPRSIILKNGEMDPLAEFYDQARDEQEIEYLNGNGGNATDPNSEEELCEPHGSSEDEQKGGFQCDKKPGNKRRQSCPNQDVIDTLTELKALHEVKGTPEDKWRVFGYRRMLGPIRSFGKRIESEEEARSIHGVGAKTAKKIMEIINTGSLRRITYERTEDVYVVMAFQGIYGVGQKTAYRWYINGCRSLEDVKEGKFGVKLSPAQEIGLKYYEDINSRMPRYEAKEIFEFIKAAALRIDPHLFVEILGSYRRGKETCGDIDILITRPTSDGKTHAGVLATLIDDLYARRVITAHLSVPDNWDDLDLCYHGLCRRSGIDKMRRIDFLCVPYESRGAALLYYTGDDIFNRSMRLKANKMGYSLNQRGLYKDVIRDPSNRLKKLHKGTIVASETEREIFDILGVPWQEPHERVRNQ